MCFQTVETAPKLDSEKNGVCIGIYSVSKGCACRRGGVTIYIYIYMYICTYVCMYACMCTDMYVCTYACFVCGATYFNVL